MIKKVSRREFIRKLFSTGIAVGLPISMASLYRCGDEQKPGRAKRGHEAIKPQKLKVYPSAGYRGNMQVPKVLLISIDSLPPEYLEMNSRGERGGKVGDWLMPNVREFLNRSTWFHDARCHMPAATDMNHLNAIAATSSAQTGVIGISLQPVNWNHDGTGNLSPISLSWARDDRGRPVDTLFNAFKRRWPRSRTLYASGKPWVAEMFRTDSSGVDMLLTGSFRPRYIDPPGGEISMTPRGIATGFKIGSPFIRRDFAIAPI
jgi:hypothetical protein